MSQEPRPVRSPGRSRPKGGRYEREIARQLGGRRTPLSGASGGNDLTFPTESIWSVWGIEAKRRANLPVFVTKALEQAAAALPLGSPRRPALVMREDGGRSIFVAGLEDVRTWAEALNETGRGSRLRELARQLDAVSTELRRLG